MRIIIDGNDGIGKTTLAKKLQIDLGIRSYIHLTGDDERGPVFYSQINLKKDVIFDRSFISEPIYSQIFERSSLIDEKCSEYLHEQIKALGTIVIICQASKRHTRYSKNEHPLIIKNRKLINSYFATVAKKYNYYIYFPRKSNYNKLLAYIKDQDNKNKEER